MFFHIGRWSRRASQPAGRRDRTDVRSRRYPSPPPDAPHSPSSTTTCSSCAAPSGPSPRWPTSGRTRRSSRCSTTRRAPQGRFAGRTVTTSPLQRLGVRQGNFRALLPLFPTAARRLDLGGFDCVVSSSSAFAHGVRQAARRACTSATATRRSATPGTSGRARWPRCRRRCGRCSASLLRRHRGVRPPRRCATVDRYVANGEITRERIRRFWGATPSRASAGRGRALRDRRAGRPRPVRRRAGAPQAPRGGDRGGGRGGPARSRSSAPGPELERLRARYGEQARVPRPRRRRASSPASTPSAAALVVPNVEEFGIAAVEAQAAGRPVVAVDAGGVRETVVPGRTGLLVPRRRPERARARPARATSRASTRTTSARTPSASRAPPSGHGCARSSKRRAPERPALAPGALAAAALVMLTIVAALLERDREVAGTAACPALPRPVGRALPGLGRRGRALQLRRHRLRAPRRGRRRSCATLGVRHIRDGLPAPEQQPLIAGPPGGERDRDPGDARTPASDATRQQTSPTRSRLVGPASTPSRGPTSSTTAAIRPGRPRCAAHMPALADAVARQAPGVALVGPSFVDPGRQPRRCPPTCPAWPTATPTPGGGAARGRAGRRALRGPPLTSGGAASCSARWATTTRCVRPTGQPPASEEAAAVYLPRLAAAPPSGRGAPHVHLRAGRQEARPGARGPPVQHWGLRA